MIKFKKYAFLNAYFEIDSGWDFENHKIYTINYWIFKYKNITITRGRNAFGGYLTVEHSDYGNLSRDDRDHYEELVFKSKKYWINNDSKYDLDVDFLGMTFKRLPGNEDYFLFKNPLGNISIRDKKRILSRKVIPRIQTQIITMRNLWNG